MGGARRHRVHEGAAVDEETSTLNDENPFLNASVHETGRRVGTLVHILQEVIDGVGNIGTAQKYLNRPKIRHHFHHGQGNLGRVGTDQKGRGLARTQGRHQHARDPYRDPPKRTASPHFRIPPGPLPMAPAYHERGARGELPGSCFSSPGGDS